MESKKDLFFKIDVKTIGIPLLAVLVIWLVYWAEIRFGLFLNPYGVQPRSIKGLRGIVFSPFIHGSIEHLYSNTIPIFLLSFSLFYFYRKLAAVVLIGSWLFSGAFIWFIGESYSTHIGASGIVYGLASFLFFKGIWSKHYRLMALSLVVVFFYGSFVWGILPGREGISWEGHLGGFIAGVLLALLYKKYQLPQKKYTWEEANFNEEEDEFMRHFDKDGNFIPSSELYPQGEETTTDITTMDDTKVSPPRIVYCLRQKTEGDKHSD